MVICGGQWCNSLPPDIAILLIGFFWFELITFVIPDFMRKLILIVLVFIFILAFSETELAAQCAMCKATAENSIREGKATIGLGINTGILYLAAFPYLIVATLGYLWYRGNRKRKLMDLMAEVN